MKEFFPVLHAAPLFSGISDEELAAMLSCLGARIGTFPKGARLLRAGESVEEVGLVLAGTAPGAQANTSAKVCPGPILERMLRFPQMSSCTTRALPASTRPTSSTASPARSRRAPLGKVPILAPRQESMAESSSSEMPEKSAAV